MRLALLLIIFSIKSSFATTFAPISLKQMIEGSSAMVEGEVLFSRTEELENKEIVTITSIDLTKWSGVEGKKIIEVYSPGGTVGERTTLIEGAPDFKEGEQVFLFLKEFNTHYWVSNLSLGTYRFKNLGAHKMLVNSVFPYHPEIGQISPKELYSLAERVKQIKFQSKPRDKYQVMRENRKLKKNSPNYRQIASTEEIEGEKTKQYNIYWLLAILAVVGSAWTFKKQRE